MGRYDSTEHSHFTRSLIIALVVTVIVGVVYISQLDKPYEQTTEALSVPKEQPVNDIQPAYQLSRTKKPPEQQQEETALTTQQTEEIVAPLPTLEQSDPAFKQGLLSLSANLSAWLTTNDLIQKYIVIFNDASQGLRPYKHFRFLTLNTPFTVKEDQQGIYLNPESYQRYNKLAAAIYSLDVQASMNFYNKFRPLFLQVFSQFGYPEQYQLEDIFKKTGAIILQAPIIEDRINLIPHAIRYKFKDPQLETLDPLQKQMIRMGPENTRIIQNKTRLLIEALVNEENL